MRFDIHYATNDQLWSMEHAAAKAGYEKTEECYWTQIFTNGENTIVTIREDAADIIGDPVARFKAIVNPEPVQGKKPIETHRERYDYRGAMLEDIKEYIRDNYTADEISDNLNDPDEWGERLHDEMWMADSVTGNASGSYTFSTYRAEEFLCHNLDLLAEAVEEFCGDMDVLKNGAEACDVTIRCYLLGQVLAEALEDLMEEYGVTLPF